MNWTELKGKQGPEVDKTFDYTHVGKITEGQVRCWVEVNIRRQKSFSRNKLIVIINNQRGASSTCQLKGKHILTCVDIYSCLQLAEMLNKLDTVIKL